MAAKNKKRRPTGFHMQHAFAAHLKAHQRAQEWAVKCLAYRETRKPVRAKYAQKRARHWLKKAMLLEGRTGPTSLFGGPQGFAALNDDG
jgi:hypothetical protein